MKLKDFLALIPNRPIDASGVSKPSGYCAEHSYGYFRQKHIFFDKNTLSFCPWTPLLFALFN